MIKERNKIDYFHFGCIRDNLDYYYRDVYRNQEIEYNEDYIKLKFINCGDTYEIIIEPDFIYANTRNYFDRLIDIIEALTIRNIKYNDLCKITINGKTNIHKILNREEN